jgi:hypothetical protein
VARQKIEPPQLEIQRCGDRAPSRESEDDLIVGFQNEIGPTTIVDAEPVEPSLGPRSSGRCLQFRERGK